MRTTNLHNALKGLYTGGRTGVGGGGHVPSDPSAGDDLALGDLTCESLHCQSH